MTVSVPAGFNAIPCKCARARGASSVKHFTIAIKAWIPRPEVVVLNLKEKIKVKVPHIGTVSADAWLKTTFRGDDHLRYDGPYRVHAYASFSVERGRITRVRVGCTQGTTTLNIKGGVHVAGVGFSEEVHWKMKGKPTARGPERLRPNSFRFTVSATDPFLPPNPIPWLTKLGGLGEKAKGALSVDSHVQVDLSGGNLSVHGATNRFPSYGLRLSGGGRPADVRIIYDASNVSTNAIPELIRLSEDQPFFQTFSLG